MTFNSTYIEMYLKILCFLILLNLSNQIDVVEFEKNFDANLFDSSASQVINVTEFNRYTNLDDNEDTQSINNRKVVEIYKIIMIFTCCVLAIVLICFLICILRNSDILTSNSTESQENLNDVYSRSDDSPNNILNSNNFLINLPLEKPPTYLDVLKEIGQPPPIYQANLNNNQQSHIVTFNSDAQLRHDQLILDCNRWLEASNNERSSLESRLLESRLAEYRQKLRKLSKDLERCDSPIILLRSHSSPIIRNSLLLRSQNLSSSSTHYQ